MVHVNLIAGMSLNVSVRQITIVSLNASGCQNKCSANNQKSETLDEKETTIKSDKKCWIKINTNDCFHYKMDDGKTLLCIVISDELKKKKRIYKKKNELFYSKRVSYKCLECRFDRKKCITNNYYETCNRCAKSKSKKCVYDARLYS